MRETLDARVREYLSTRPEVERKAAERFYRCFGYWPTQVCLRVAEALSA